MTMRNALRPLSVALSLLLAGCASSPLVDGKYTGPFYAPTNCTRSEKLPTEIRRVLVLPVAVGRTAPGETGDALSEALLEQLHRVQRFEVVSVSRSELARDFGVSELDSTALLPTDSVARLAARAGADAVLFTDLTAFVPYRPQVLGLRAKLVRSSDAKILWAFDEVVSAARPDVRNSARRREGQSAVQSDPFDLGPAALQSPRWFAGFVAEEMFRTLPTR